MTLEGGDSYLGGADLALRLLLNSLVCLTCRVSPHNSADLLEDLRGEPAYGRHMASVLSPSLREWDPR